MYGKIYRQILSHIRDGLCVVLTTNFSGEQGKITGNMTKQIFNEQVCSKIYLEVLRQGLPVVQTQPNATTLTEPFYPEERLIVLGGGHIAVSLVEFGAKIGFSVTVVDDRPSFANCLRFPTADNVICDSFDRAIEKLKITRNDFVVIITRGHRFDQFCMEQILSGTEPFYTGMIGSRRRVAAMIDILAFKGYDNRRLNRIHSPIGLQIGAVTPEEIALSIAAQLVESKRLKAPDDSRYRNRSDVNFDVLNTLADNTDESLAVVTVISAKGSVPRGAGAKMLVYPDGRIIGSIGGGCSEAAVIGTARQIIGTGEYSLQTVDMTGDVAEDEGMVCGGIMTVLIEDFISENTDRK